MRLLDGITDSMDMSLRKGHNVMQIAGAEGIITDRCDNERKNTNREGA